MMLMDMDADGPGPMPLGELMMADACMPGTRTVGPSHMPQDLTSDITGSTANIPKANLPKVCSLPYAAPWLSD
jgi:hypothetical protein